MSTIANLPADDPRALRLTWTSSSPPPLPPALLMLERPPANGVLHYGTYRVGMVLFQLDTPRPSWMLGAPWRAPERSIRTASLVTQLLTRCEAMNWSFDLLAFPAGTLNYHGTDASSSLVLAAPEVQHILSTLRRTRRTITSVVFGVDVWSYTDYQRPDRSAGIDAPPNPDAAWQFLVAAEAGGQPTVYQRAEPGIEEEGWLRPGDGSDRLVTLAGRRIRLGLDEEQFETKNGEPKTLPADDARLWLNPIHVNHPGGGVSAGRWPVARVETTLRGSSCPVFLPHYRRTRLDGPFWFAGHPGRSRPHRWQPVDETWFRCQDSRLHLLTFDLNDDGQR